MNQTLFNWAKRSYSLSFLSLGLFLALGAALILAACSSSSDSQSDTLIDVVATEGSSGMPSCTPDEVVAAPGETIRFIIENNTAQQLEFILTDNEGLQKRRNAVADESVLGVLFDGDTSSSRNSNAGIANIFYRPNHSPGNYRHSPGDENAFKTYGKSASQIHEGHEDEAGSDPTEDFRYRSLIDAKRATGPGVRTMLVTFPEVGEGYVLEHFICAYPDSTDLDEGNIVRRSR